MSYSQSFRQFYVSSVIALSAFSGAISAARAETAKDPNSVDILGFHLGMTPDEVKSLATSKINAPKIEVKQGASTMGSYKTPPRVFSMRVFESDAGWYGSARPGKEYLQFAFSPKEPFPLLYIQRNRFFDTGSASNVEQIKASLIEKYGPPDGQDGVGNTISVMYWSYNSSLKYSKTDNTCKSGVTSASVPLIAGQVIAPSPYDNSEKCGTWLRVQVSTFADNPQLVQHLDIYLTNMKEIHDAMLSTLEMLKKGADDALRGHVGTAAPL